MRHSFVAKFHRSVFENTSISCQPDEGDHNRLWSSVGISCGIQTVIGGFIGDTAATQFSGVGAYTRANIVEVMGSVCLRA